MKIKRKALIKLAFQTIKDVEREYDLVPTDSDRKHLLYAACTMDNVALGSWGIDDKCGCLVGTMQMNEGISPHKPTDNEALYEIGEHFDALLRNYLDANELDGSQLIVEVKE